MIFIRSKDLSYIAWFCSADLQVCLLPLGLPKFIRPKGLNYMIFIRPKDLSYTISA